MIAPRTLLVSLLLGLTVVGTASATSYFVTQSGAGSHSGIDLADAWSVANYNASSTPTGGDTVFFSGTITSTITQNKSGTGNGASRLTMDFTGSCNGCTAATLSTATPRFNINSKNFLNIYGGTIAPSTSGTFFTNNNGSAHDVTLSGWSYTGADATYVSFIHITGLSNFVLENNTLTGLGDFIDGDSSSTHDLTIQNNLATTNINTIDQTDVIIMGDAYNVTIQGNKFVNRSPGQNNNGQHNDVIQTYHGGSGGGANPSGWVVRYNWIELDMTSTFRTGDNSWMQLESFDNTHGGFGLKIYSNVFVGDGPTFSGNNGFGADSHGITASNYVYNNTIIRKNGPDRTIGWVGSGATLFMRNNVFEADLGEGGTDVDVASQTPGTGGYDYNFWYHLDGAVTSGTTGAHGSSATDPQFTSYSGGDYSLGAGSPLINAGDSSVGSEFNQGPCSGATWPNPTLCTRSAGAWDVGAYQSGGGNGAPDPPTGLNAQVQ